MKFGINILYKKNSQPTWTTWKLAQWQRKLLNGVNDNLISYFLYFFRNMYEISYRNSLKRLKITRFEDVDLVHAVLNSSQLNAQSHIRIYVFHIFRPCLLKFRTKYVHKKYTRFTAWLFILLQPRCDKSFGKICLFWDEQCLNNGPYDLLLNIFNRFRCSRKAVANTRLLACQFDVCWTVHHCDNWRIRTN